MTQIHEAGEVWHIGWDWYAAMWFVEPPDDVELPDGEPMLWYADRDKAFGFVDTQIREQPVINSPVDEIPSLPFELTKTDVPDNPTLPAYVPRDEREELKPWEDLVRNPVGEQPNEDRAARLEYYSDRVGLK